MSDGVWFLQWGHSGDLLFVQHLGGQHLTQVQCCKLGLLERGAEPSHCGEIPMRKHQRW